MTCVWRPETAACRTARIEQGLPSDDTPAQSECRSGCGNRADTYRDIAALRLQYIQLTLDANDTLTPNHCAVGVENSPTAQLIIERHDRFRRPTSKDKTVTRRRRDLTAERATLTGAADRLLAGIPLRATSAT